MIDNNKKITSKNKVFLSYKNTKNGIQTKDSQIAQKLYDELLKNGINAFFASKTLLEAGTDRYKEYIDKELDDCYILIVIGTSVENISSRWVKYEWDGFMLDILNGCKKKLFTYVDGINPHDLPRTLRGVQSFDMSQISLDSFVKVIQNAIYNVENIEPQNETPKNANRPIREKVDFDPLNDSDKLSDLFLHPSDIELKKSKIKDLEDEIARVSSLFEDIHIVKHGDEAIESQDLAKTIDKIVLNSIKSKNLKLLKIKGPIGSYKTKFIKYLYLFFSKKYSDYMFFYIDLEVYIKIINEKTSFDIRNIETMIINHFKQIKECVNSKAGCVPIIIIDGISDFSSEKDNFYSIVKSQLSSIDCKIIVNIDTDFTCNPKNKFTLHPLAETDFDYFIRIYSLSTYNKNACIKFIRNCMDVFHIKILHNGINEEIIYDRLVNLGIVNLDAYWLKILIKEITAHIFNTDITVADLYESICVKGIDSNFLYDASKLAFEYEYGNIDISNKKIFFDKKWEIIRKHRTVLEYLIAKYYIKIFEMLDYQNIESIGEQLHFFEMILPKSVSIFIVSMFRKFDDYENKVLTIAKRYYDNMSTFGRNEFVYWLGRISSNVRKEECKKFLKNVWPKQRLHYLNGTFEDGNQKKNEAFLYRTISLSLIVQEDKEVAKVYFNDLLNDKICNEINRGFHLAYYGDIKFIPSKTLLDFADRIHYGQRTFDSLFVSIEAKKKNNKFNCLLILELFTICSLLQARIESLQFEKELKNIFKSYAIKTIEILKWVLTQRRLNEFDKMRLYFEWIIGELHKYYINDEIYSSAKTLSILGKALDVKRTGWINRKVSSPENIVEHMYSCWLIGVLFLPNSSDNANYNKNLILDMLLLHDLGETETGDIPRPEKKLNERNYDEKENKTLQSLFFSGTYPNSTCLSYFSDCWDAWYKSNCINALIAKDIDIIQALYKYCIYYTKSEISVDSDDAKEWFDELYYVTTPEGRHIAELLIIKNPLFKDIVFKYGKNTENYFG